MKRVIVEEGWVRSQEQVVAPIKPIFPTFGLTVWDENKRSSIIKREVFTISVQSSWLAIPCACATIHFHLESIPSCYIMMEASCFACFVLFIHTRIWFRRFLHEIFNWVFASPTFSIKLNYEGQILLSWLFCQCFTFAKNAGTKRKLQSDEEKLTNMGNTLIAQSNFTDSCDSCPLMCKKIQAAFK